MTDDNDNVTGWSSTTTTTTPTPTIPTKPCGEETSEVATAVKQRKFSFKHGKVAADNYCDDDNDDDIETLVVTMMITMIDGREW